MMEGRVDTHLIESSLNFTDADAERADEHRYGGVRDVVGHPDQADHHRVVANIKNADVHASHVEAVLREVGEAVSLAQADEDLAAGESDALHLAQLRVKLLLQLVDDLRNANVTEERIVLCTKHHCIGLDAVQADNVSAKGSGLLGCGCM